MAANFWTSSHFKQLLDPEEVDVVHNLDKERGITLEDFKLIKLDMAKYIVKLAQYVKVRQRVVATAITYMRRVYVRKSMTEYDPRLVAPACLYLASKSEESTVQARLLVFYIKKIRNVPNDNLYCTTHFCLLLLGPSLFFVLFADSDEKYRYEVKEILEMEMKLLETLNYYLAVYHPYHSVSQLLRDAGMSDAIQLVWGIINDTYKMDLMLIHPPHLIALASIYIASVLKDKENTAWFEELRVDMNIVKNIAMEILDFYESFETITNDDERINAAMNKLDR